MVMRVQMRACAGGASRCGLVLAARACVHGRAWACVGTRTSGTRSGDEDIVLDF